MATTFTPYRDTLVQTTSDSSTPQIIGPERIVHPLSVNHLIKDLVRALPIRKSDGSIGMSIGQEPSQNIVDASRIQFGNGVEIYVKTLTTDVTIADKTDPKEVVIYPKDSVVGELVYAPDLSKVKDKKERMEAHRLSLLTFISVLRTLVHSPERNAILIDGNGEPLHLERRLDAIFARTHPLAARRFQESFKSFFNGATMPIRFLNLGQKYPLSIQATREVALASDPLLRERALPNDKSFDLRFLSIPLSARFFDANKVSLSEQLTYISLLNLSAGQFLS